MKKFGQVVRAVVMSLVAVCVFVPAALYVVLSTDWAQEQIRQAAQRELSNLMGTQVTIGKVAFTPFSRIDITDVTIADDYGKTALEAQRLEARFEFWNFVTSGRLAFDYAVLRRTDIHLYKQTADSPLNIAGIIEKLKGKDEKKEPTSFDLMLGTLRLEDAHVTYDILDVPETPGKFNPAHIDLDRLNLTATAPRLSNKEIAADIRNLSFKEHCGLAVTDMGVDVKYTPTGIDINGLYVRLPLSYLDLGSYAFRFASADELKDLFSVIPVKASVLPGSYVTLSDLGCVVPALAGVDRRFNLSATLQGTVSEIDIPSLKIDEVTDGGLLLDISANIVNPLKRDSADIRNLKLDMEAYAPSVTDLVRKFAVNISPRALDIINRQGHLRLNVAAQGNLHRASARVDYVSRMGSVMADAAGRFDSISGWNIDKAIINASAIDLGALTGDTRLGKASVQLSAAGNARDFSAQVKSGHLSYKDSDYTVTDTWFRLSPDGTFAGQADISALTARLTASVNGSTDPHRPGIAGQVNVSGFNPHALGLTDKYPGYVLDVTVDADIAGVKGQWLDGYVSVKGLNFRPETTAEGDERPALYIKEIRAAADNTVRPNIIEISSDFLNGTFSGNVSFLNLIPQIKQLLHPIMPAFIPQVTISEEQKRMRDNDFRFNLTVDHADNLLKFFRVPVDVVYPVEIEGLVNIPAGNIIVGVDAPYLMKGDMIIENTSVQANIDSEARNANVYLTTQFPTKKGDMVVVGGISVADNTLDTRLKWTIERQKPIEGTLGVITNLGRDTYTGKLTVDAEIQPSEIRFGADVWHMDRSRVTFTPGHLGVDGFRMASTTQSLAIDGSCDADNDEHELTVRLDNIVLNTIFETLDINKALLTGVATGTFHASGIFGDNPVLECRDLHVEGIGYNHCVLGTGDIYACWNNDRKSFYLDADITEDDGRHSYIKGDIFPGTESLDIRFDADHVKVGFMKPFMEAFATDVTGYASGWARLFGTFKYIDMEGDLYAQDLGLKVGFTNAWYYATDSIHLRPGIIDIPSVTVRDAEGHTATLNGWVRHTFFKDPVFDFRVTDARNFLSYDVTPALSPDWYGRVYGNGAAFINGKPGVVNIDVNMTTAPNSTFTFVLSDLEEAEQYSFLTFRDKNAGVITDSIIQVDILPAAVRQARDAKAAKAAQLNPPSAYNMNIQVDITPQAKIILVMDPVGGDEIKCNGNGNLRMTYTMPGNDLRMYGTYTIERGTYNFTLQDIIVKDFTIKEGSSITFSGDPYSAALDIAAYYGLTANLTDLDESFMHDTELNRTNVPVRALLLVRGDMRQPNIDFDLEFPTLSTDIYRKVRSIVSTDEMMNRQIIYLLALNRFYTPEYMTATKGSELFSVASSTISSRLSSMLGKLSENWTIQPNIRSDRGDFSDVQFDLALSSTLLNNRLRLDGNFGYRDKSLNTNQFIGDFDMEYLLNRSGSWRLKAYNRFNDQTYFLRTAKTTQGVGIMFRRDFDNMFNFLKRKRKKEPVTTEKP